MIASIITSKSAVVWLILFSILSSLCLHGNQLEIFLSELERAEYGDTLFVGAGMNLDMTGLVNLTIPAGVTIMGRGNERGEYPLLFTDFIPMNDRINPLFVAGGDNITVAKIKLRGPYNPEDRIDIPGSVAIRNRGFTNMTITDCEISRWHFSGLLFDYGARNNKVTKSFIHRNNRPGYGYGVTIGEKSFAKIEHNHFDHNRHDIAGGGCPESGYAARHNIIGENGTSHSFDMHGGFDRDDGTDFAGCCITIENNDFHVRNHWAVVIRGVPSQYGIIRNNRFFGQKNNVRSNSVKQLNAFGNLRVGPNYYEYNYLEMDKPGWVIKFTNQVNTEYESIKNLELSDAEWLLQTNYLVDDVYVGDFNGDGVSDVLIVAASGRFYVSWGALVSWKTAGKLLQPISQVLTGDMNGNGVDDILVQTDSGWHILDIATKEFRLVEGFDLEAEDLFINDFSGERRSEILFHQDEKWYLTTLFDDVELYPVPFAGLKNILVGDFTGDGQAEIFWEEGGYIHFHGQGAGTTRLDIAGEISDIYLSDFSGDGIDELFFADGYEWQLFSYRQTVPVVIRKSSLLTKQLLFGDFNGSGMTDIVFRNLN